MRGGGETVLTLSGDSGSMTLVEDKRGGRMRSFPSREKARVRAALCLPGRERARDRIKAHQSLRPQ